MKKLFTFAIALVSLLFASCDKDDEGVTTPPITTPSELSFIGTVTSGDDFTQAGKVKFKVIIAADGTSTLWMYKPQFSNGMPAMFDMEIPNIQVSESGKTTTLSGSSLIPQVNEVVMDEFVMTNLEGTISENSFKLEFTCRGVAVKYEGYLEEETFAGTLTSTKGEESYVQDGKVDFKVYRQLDGSVTLWMYEPTFAAGMTGFTITVPSITIVGTTLSAGVLTPYIGEDPYPSYKITKLDGTVSATELNLVIEFEMGYTVTYKGAIKK